MPVFLQSFLRWFFYLALGWIWDKLILPAWNAYQANKEAKKIAEENLRKYKEALEKGDPDAIAQAAEDILNGRKS